jgi:hypothetical protein
VKEIALHDHLPDYRLVFDEQADMVIFYNRDNKWVERPLPSDGETLPALPEEAYQEGRAAAPGYDIYALETEWREFWVSSGKPALNSPAAAFVVFCRHRNKTAPIKRETWDDAPARDENSELF